MQTISTKYLGATNSKPSRIIAKTSSGKRISLSYDHALNDDKNHMKAAKELMTRLQWPGRMVGGHTKDGMVFVVADMAFMDYSINA
jgi:hypothetical protein